MARPRFDLFAAPERLMRVDEAAWDRHANPWSVYSRMAGAAADEPARPAPVPAVLTGCSPAPRWRALAAPAPWRRWAARRAIARRARTARQRSA